MRTKNVSYRGKNEIPTAEGKVVFDRTVWQQQDTGDFIHTLTGEVREADQFLGDGERESEAGGITNDWDDVSQVAALQSSSPQNGVLTTPQTEFDGRTGSDGPDSMGDDFVAAQVKTASPTDGKRQRQKQKNKSEIKPLTTVRLPVILA